MAITSSGSTLHFDDGSTSVHTSFSIIREGYDSAVLFKQYDELIEKYKQLGKSVQYTLQYLILKNNIDVSEIMFRPKSFSKFWEKCLRKKYKDPFNDMPDICGLRVICYHNSDKTQLEEIIKKEFDVAEVEERKDVIYEYNTPHYIVTLKPNWLDVPIFRGLNCLKVEIQIRTLLMHAWSDISRKFVYNNEENIPSDIKKKLGHVNSRIITIDEKLEKIKQELSKYPQKDVKKPFGKSTLKT